MSTELGGGESRMRFPTQLANYPVSDFSEFDQSFERVLAVERPVSRTRCSDVENADFGDVLGEFPPVGQYSGWTRSSGVSAWHGACAYLGHGDDPWCEPRVAHFPVGNLVTPREEIESEMIREGEECAWEREQKKGKRVRRGGRGRGGRARTEVSPARSVTSLCADLVSEVVGEPRGETDKLAVLVAEDKVGYSYLTLIRAEYVVEEAQRCGPCPTLRELVKCGPKRFRPVVDLNNAFMELRSGCAVVVSTVGFNAAYVRFWALVRSIPEREMSREWKAAVSPYWAWCAVPGAARPGFRVA